MQTQLNHRWNQHQKPWNGGVKRLLGFPESPPFSGIHTVALGPHDSTDADSRTPGPPRAMILLFIRGCGSRQYGKSISSDPLIRAVRSLILLPGQEFNILGLIVPRDTASMMALILSSREDVLRVSCLALSCVSVKVRWLSRLLHPLDGATGSLPCMTSHWSWSFRRLR